MLAPIETIRVIRHVLLLIPAIVLGAVSIFAWSDPVHAVSCGETLGPGDPVVLSEDLSCATSPALTVEGPVTIDLGGFTVACDPAGGTGLDLIGNQAQVQDGTIKNCAKGVVVEGDGGHRLMALRVKSPDVSGDGGIAFQVKSSRNGFFQNTVKKFAGEGFRLGDDDVTADRNLIAFNRVVDSANHGFRVRIGEHNVFGHNRAKRNTGEGFRSQGSNNRFFSNRAIDNGDEGFRIRDETAQNNSVIDNRVEGNGLVPCDIAAEDANPGIAVVLEAASNKISRNDVQGNCIGIAVDAGAVDNTITHNTALGSTIVDMADVNLGCDHNEWRDNEFNSSVALPVPNCIR